MSNWLVKFASKQPAPEVQLRQQIESLPVEDLERLSGVSSTEHIDSFKEKAASAIMAGRRLAHERGTELVEKKAQEEIIDQALVDAVSTLSDDDAIKMAEMLANGTDVEKIAGLMGMAGQALKGIGQFAGKNPHMAAGLGGAALGAIAGGPNHRLGGALMGGAAGYGAAKMIPGATGAIQKGAFGASMKGQQMMMPKMAEVEEIYKVAFLSSSCPSPGGQEGSWLTQFEGSPLIEQAIALAQEEVQNEVASIQKRQERQAMFKNDDEEWTKNDIIRARKHLLELQLVAQRNGLGQQGAAQPPADPQPENPQPKPQQQTQSTQQPPPQGVGGAGGVQMPLGGQEKQASAMGVAGALGGAIGGAARKGMIGAGVGAGLGALTAPEGERANRAAAWGKKGLVAGGAIGAVGGAMGGHALGETAAAAQGLGKVASASDVLATIGKHVRGAGHELANAPASVKGVIAGGATGAAVGGEGHRTSGALAGAAIGGGVGHAHGHAGGPHAFGKFASLPFVARR